MSPELGIVSHQELNVSLFPLVCVCVCVRVHSEKPKWWTDEIWLGGHLSLTKTVKNLSSASILEEREASHCDIVKVPVQKTPRQLRRAAPTSWAQRFRFRCSSPSPSGPFWGCTWLRPSFPWPSPEPSPLPKTLRCEGERERERNMTASYALRPYWHRKPFHLWVDRGHSEAHRPEYTNNILWIFTENWQSSPTLSNSLLCWLTLVSCQKHGKHF